MIVGRPQLARAYVWLTFLVAGVVFVQGLLFGAFYSEGDSAFIDAHGIVGELSGYFAILVLIPCPISMPPVVTPTLPSR